MAGDGPGDPSDRAVGANVDPAMLKPADVDAKPELSGRTVTHGQVEDLVGRGAGAADHPLHVDDAGETLEEAGPYGEIMGVDPATAEGTRVYEAVRPLCCYYPPRRGC